MNITESGHSAHVGAAAEQRRQAEHKGSFDRFKIGEQLQLQVREQLAANRYLVEFAGTRHIVEAAMQLTAGAALTATVVAVGEQLELRCIGPLESHALRDMPGAVRVRRESDDSHAQQLEDASQAFAIVLSDADHAAVAAKMRKVAQPLDMAHSGLFLSKLQQPMEASALSALYAALTWHTSNAPRAAEIAIDTIDADVRTAAQRLETDLAAELAAQSATATIAAESSSASLPEASDGGSAEERLARQLLNKQDDGAIAYSFGSLPILMADQLIELDVVLFRDRQAASAPTALRRLVMTLQTERFGRVEVMAQALGERLTIAIKADTQAASDALAAHADEAHSLVTQLGWTIEAIEYDVDPLRTRAAREIVQHVLKAGSVDRWV